jgi:hypothetical protein
VLVVGRELYPIGYDKRKKMPSNKLYILWH